MTIREVNLAGVALVKRFEGKGTTDPQTGHFLPYLDPVSIWTIGYGHAIAVNGVQLIGPARQAEALALYPGGLSPDQGDALLRSDLMNAARDVQSAVHTPLNDNQFAALVSFTFNLGIGRLQASTLLKKVNLQAWDEAANEFQKWVYAGKVIVKGLVTRRAAERALFQEPMTPGSAS